MTSPEIQQVVTEVYSTHDLLPPEWTIQQRRDFVDDVAGRLSRQVADLAAELGEQAIQEWIRQTGDHPDVMTKVGLVNNATLHAKELVLSQELFELIPAPPEDPLARPKLPERGQVPWDRRWTHTEFRTDPTEEHEDLVTAVWPDPTFSALFRIKAGYLIAALAEDQQALPTDQHDPLAQRLARMVLADLRADGLPER